MAASDDRGALKRKAASEDEDEQYLMIMKRVEDLIARKNYTIEVVEIGNNQPNYDIRINDGDTLAGRIWVFMEIETVVLKPTRSKEYSVEENVVYISSLDVEKNYRGNCINSVWHM